MKRLLVFLILVLVGCSDSQEKITEEIEENHTNVEFVNVRGEEDVDGNITILEDTFNFKEGKVKSEIVNMDSISYKDNEAYFTHSLSGYPSLPPDKLGTMRASLDRKESLNKNPFIFFKKYDNSFTENLTMEENDDLYLFTYEPDDEERESFYENFILEFLFYAQNENQDNDPLEELQIDLESFELTFEVDATSKLITKMITNEKATLELEGTSITLNRKTTYEFSNYDDVVDIEIPEEAFEITTIDTYMNDF